ncbi:hypothetical protein HG530_009937 [Fusarium avenaceum]|nr:hypothetical protein HG530_009937 [Fusarium avenaceum]
MLYIANSVKTTRSEFSRQSIDRPFIRSNLHKEVKSPYPYPQCYPIHFLLVANTKALLAAAVTLLGLATTFTPARAAVTKFATLASLASLSTAMTILRHLERRAVTLDWDAGNIGCLHGHRVGNNGRGNGSLGDLGGGRVSLLASRLVVQVGVLALGRQITTLEVAVGSRNRAGGFGKELLAGEVGRSLEVLGLASAVDLLAVIVPGIAAMAASWGSVVPAVTNLIPARLRSGPASVLSGVLGDGSSTPVGVLGQTCLGNKAFLLLLLLLGACLLGGGVPNLRPRDGVLTLIGIDVVGHSRILLVHIARDAGFVFLGDLKGTRGAVLDEDLSTAVVELRVTFGGTVESKDLRADQIVASRKSSGEIDRKKTAVGSESIDTPLLRLGVVSILPDFEPAIASSLVRVHIVNLLHIDRTRSLVAFGNGALFVVAGGLAELEGQLSTAWGWADELDGLVTIFTCISVSSNFRHALTSIISHTASHDISGDRVNRAVGFGSILRLTDTGSITLVLAINEESGEEGVGVRSRGEAKNGSEKLHVEFF